MTTANTTPHPSLKSRSISLDLIKWLAMLTMVIDHLRLVWPEMSNLFILGRLSFPLFCVAIAANVARSKPGEWLTAANGRYLALMLLFAAISEVPYRYISTSGSFNVLVTNEIQAGRLKVDDPVTVSENAWKTGGSRMFLDPGAVVPVHDLLRGVVIDSGNDASVALSEHIAGSEDAFAGLMNVTANKLGLTDTHFMNPTGLPAPGHYSSAHDMARLARAIINDESAYYPLYAHKYFTWNNIRQPNRNLLLWRDPSVDGLKTGHTEEAGYCMVTSALRDGRRLISAVFGSTTLNNRAEDAQKILNYGFRFFETKTYQKGGQVLAQPRLWKGEKNVISVGLLDDVTLTLPKNSNRKVESRLHINNALEAPIAVGDIVGSYELYDGENKLVTRSLIALEAGEAGGWWTRTWDAFHLFFAGLFDVKDDTGEVKA